VIVTAGFGSAVTVSVVRAVTVSVTRTVAVGPGTVRVAVAVAVVVDRAPDTVVVAVVRTVGPGVGINVGTYSVTDFVAVFVTVGMSSGSSAVWSSRAGALCRTEKLGVGRGLASPGDVIAHTTAETTAAAMQIPNRSGTGHAGRARSPSGIVSGPSSSSRIGLKSPGNDS
jgi:hypothetical protein